MLELDNGSYYTGYTTDLRRRYEAHRSAKGAKITRSFKPVQILAAWRVVDLSTALKFEAAIKKLSRAEKEELLTVRSVGRRFGLVGIRRIRPTFTEFN